ncbi:DUF551 domain-containing protein [Pasteurella multocida]|uniref:DUF551 domain-containing protein n=1 Tax=Pasteurella multocida TaxID=747 RepID=UPI002B88E6B2|nr:DUF551 domain-containing protein [Pasteurella multocida]MEB3501825.1 DUF551 domain-containing protein [Pasteurella multocida]
MTETENKYFSVDVSNDIHIVKLHETLEQAKQSCLDGAVEAHEFADDMCDHEDFALNDLPYAVYGIVLGKADCKEKQLSEEEKEDYGSDLVLEQPELVEFLQNNGWISVKDKLPKKFDRVLVCQQDYKWEQNYIRIAYCNNSEGTEWWADNYDGTGDEIIFNDVTHWRPLPPIPKEIEK